MKKQASARLQEIESFLKKLYDTNTKLSFLLLEGKDLVDEFNEKELYDYIDKEINGYKLEDDLPKYRKINSQIVVDIQDAYGNLLYKEHVVDFSKLSEKVGFNLDESIISDGLAFVETSVNSLTGKTAIKPLPKEIVKMLDDVFHYNNRELHLIAAYHKMPTATLGYILSKVRQDLIQAFQKLNRTIQRESETIVDVITEVDTIVAKQKRVFVSYAWENEEHNSKIVSFVDFLRKNGFDASMDKKRSQQETATNFNQMMIEGVQNSDKVVVVLSKKYKEKADKFEGGVWQELSIMIEEMKQRKNKYIFVYFGNDSRENVTPTALLGVDVSDLKKDQDDNNFNMLFSKIKEEDIIEFSEVGKIEIEINKTEIKPFKL